MIQFIVIILLTTLLGACIKTILDFQKEKSYNKISFKETCDLTGIPIITFSCGEHKINFILDSGSSVSFITDTCAQKLGVLDESLNKAEAYINSSKVKASYAYLNLSYKNESYSVQVMCSDNYNTAFQGVKESSGVTIEGLLGSDFLDRYDYILDYSDMVAYGKKKSTRKNKLTK